MKTNQEVISAVTDAVALKKLDPIAKLAKTGVKELWTIFVRQYIVKGISTVFTALVLVASSVLLAPHVGYFALIPVAVAVGLVYNAIAYLGNPKYYALEDITKKVGDLKNEKA